jgi:hypothetical protein
MTHDTLLRAASVVAAAALLAAPYWPAIARHLSEAAKAASPYRSDIARIAAAVLLIYAACGTGLWPAVRGWEWSLVNAVTAAKVSVGLALVARAFVEAARAGQAALASRMETSS